MLHHIFCCVQIISICKIQGNRVRVCCFTTDRGRSWHGFCFACWNNCVARILLNVLWNCQVAIVHYVLAWMHRVAGGRVWLHLRDLVRVVGGCVVLGICVRTATVWPAWVGCIGGTRRWCAPLFGTEARILCRYFVRSCVPLLFHMFLRTFLSRRGCDLKYL